MQLLVSLDTWSIHYCKRTANRAADLLAKFDLPEVLEERATLPPRIREVIIEDQIQT